MSGKKYKYETIIDFILSAIKNGTIPYGKKLPSLRKISIQFKCAISVVMQAYQELELKGFIYAKEKSGFFASPKITRALPEPQNYGHSLISEKSKTNNIFGKVLESA